MRHRLYGVFLIALMGTTVAFGQSEPKKVSRVDAMKAVATRVQPDYPPMARQLRIEGEVELEVVVGETGDVQGVQIVSGNPVLTASAAQAVKHWKFKPFVEGDKAIRVVAPISLIFRL